MANFTFFPEKIIKGANSDGTSFRAEIWDFSSLVQLEAINSFLTLLLCFVFAAIAAPILMLFAILNFDGKIKLAYIFAPILGGYFLLDVTHGWLGLACLNLLTSEGTINLLIGLNIAAIVIAIFLFIFGGLIYRIVMSPVEGYTQEQLQYLDSRTKTVIGTKLIVSMLVYIMILAVLTWGSFAYSKEFIGGDGWVHNRLPHVESTIGQ